MRKKVIAGNWKMNMNPVYALEYMTEFIPLVKGIENEIIICAPYLDLKDLVRVTKGTNVKVGAQNVHWEEKGAYTGEISAPMLKELEIEYVIIGHSERRQHFAETDETVNKKVNTALENGLKPIICIGETLEQKEQGKTNEVVIAQTQKALLGVTDAELERIIIAYEPIWAIGTGKTATKEDANNCIKTIREEIGKIYGQNIANRVIILYGGSVNASNSKELFSTSDIDGALVGGASLKPQEFAQIADY